MTTKSKPLSSQFFIAKPWEWDWNKLSGEEIRQRYEAQLVTREQLANHEQALLNKVHQLKLEMWSRLDTASLQDTQEFNRKLNGLDKEYRSALRLRQKVADVISYIEKRMPNGSNGSGTQDLDLSQLHS